MHNQTSRAQALCARSVSLPGSLREVALWSLTVLLTVFAALGAEAKIGAAYQMLLGNPSNAVTDPAVKNNYLLVRDQFAISYNDSVGQPNWVSWNLTQADRGNVKRTDAWSADPLLPSGFYRVQPSDYNDPGLSRGHMCPSADRTATVADNNATFLMSNMVPQTSHNNGGVWNNFEMATRDFAAAGFEVLVVSGPSGFGSPRLASGKAAIPAYVWKVAVLVPAGTAPITERITTDTRVIALKTPNVKSGLNSDWRTYVTSVNQIQQDTGLTFFTALPEATASVLRAKIDGQVVVGAPAIEQHPQPQSVALGGTATFSVTASGNAPLSYRWSFEDEVIAGATSATLTLSNVQLEHMGSYHVTVSNSVGTATSNAALLVVTGIAPTFLNEPVSQTVNAGTNVVFSALAAGSPTMSYQWRKNGQPIDGATAETLTLTNVQAAHAGNYDVVATNGDGHATSGAATLSVTPSAPVITAQPQARSVGIGGTTSFSVTATGTEPLTYQWRKDGVAIEGNASATTAALLLTSVTQNSVGSYDVVITNPLGPVTSSAAALTISSVTDGALNYTGGTYSQNFDTLLSIHGYDSDSASSITGNGPFPLTAAPFNGGELGGWSMVKYAGSGNARFKVDNGSAINGAVYSYGASGSSDRALGSVGSGSTQSRFGFSLNNNTGQTITEFTISYVGEQWREGTSAANTLTFAYAVGATDINLGSFTNVPALSFTSPIDGTTDTNGVVLDGNAAPNRKAISATVTGVNWPAGARLIVRWSDVDDLYNDDGLAIDDFVFTATTSAPVAPAVASTTPANAATGQSVNTPVTITFNQAVTVTNGAFAITSAAKGPVAFAVTGGPSSYTLTPSASFAMNDTITVSVDATKVVDAATGTLAMAANHTFTFGTAAPVAPTITTQPASQSVAAGANVTFTVAASGTAPFTYQWRRGGQNLANATSATLTLNNVQPADAGSYDVVVSNGIGSATSNAATLTVNVVTGDAITWNFTSSTAPSSPLPAGLSGGTVAQGENAGTTTPLIDATSPSTGYPGASGGNNAGLGARTGAFSMTPGGSSYYTFTVTPDAGKRLVATAISFAVRRSSTGPQAWALYSSADNYTTVLATGAVPAERTWYFFTPSISVASAIGTPVTFRIYGYNGSGSYPGGAANFRMDDLSLTVAVQSAPTITAQPMPQSTTVGGTASFSVTASGTETLSYQWRFNGTPIPGATSSTLTLNDVQLADAGSYDVVVTNPVSSATSNAVALTVEAPPAGGFDGWRAEYFDANELANPAISGPNVVLTADGLTNFLKYALGLNPRVAATSGELPQPGSSATHWTFTFSHPTDRDDVVYDVQASTNLTDWTAIVPAVSHVGTVDGVETWRAQYPLSGASSLFFRLKVSPAASAAP